MNELKLLVVLQLYIRRCLELGLGTQLGVQGATEFVSSLDDVGIYLEKAIELSDDARKNAAKFNLNSTKFEFNTPPNSADLMAQFS